MDNNLRVSQQLIKISDDQILTVYKALKPYQSTKDELLNLAHEFEFLYGAIENANFVRSLVDVYEKKGLFKKEYK
ncbi:MAG: diol dehydratase small subunit [Cetobacterium sp.]